MPADDRYYELAGTEVTERKMHVGVMARAFSDACGNQQQSLVLYIKYRVSQLKEAEAARLKKQNDDIQAAITRSENAKKEREALAAKEAQERQAIENTMKDNRETICPKCKFAGPMLWPFIRMRLSRHVIAPI